MPKRLSLWFPLALWILGISILGISPLAAETPGPLKEIDFNRDVKPILSNKCFRCHGPDANERKGGDDGLRLDTPEGARADLGGHSAIVPGAPEKSELLRRVNSTDPDEMMPPKEAGERLSAREREILGKWIKEGGAYAGHWSYAKPVRPPLPGVKNGSWPKNEIDRFILARLEAEGLAPAPEADRYTLIRRASLDLTGLPPTWAEVEAFVNDQDPRAYEKLIDRLLAKDAYGEHWAHMWLDLARYADSAGYADDPPRKIWLYRDYVIRALNANKPFDQFTIEQIAGDLLPGATDEQILATAFHRNTLTNNEGGTNDEEFRNVAVVDRVNTTMAVWMGTTMACAQCHSHKYDPISQEEYFRFFAFFNNTADADRGDESPLISISTPEQQMLRSRYEQEIARLEKLLRTPTPELSAAQSKWEGAFPLDLVWKGLHPAKVNSAAGMAASILDDGAVHVLAGAKTDTYTLEIPLTGGALRALRLEALPSDDLPGKGPGHGGGNFVVSRVSATLVPPAAAPLAGRYLRVEIPGKQKILSLAEVQAFSGGENVATQGEAKQSSTDYDGPAKLAIDGNTDGRYVEAKSTTHTAVSDDPWWEVDLKSARPLDRVVIWNRTDNGVDDRLANFRVSLLNEQREPVWQKEVAAAPKPRVELSLGGQRELEFSAALADYAQAGFEPENVLKNADPKNKGWAVGGAVGQSHALTLLTKGAAEVPPGTTLVVRIEQASRFENHVLGRFRMAATDSAGVADWSRTPRGVLEALRVPAAERTDEARRAITEHFLSLTPELEPARKELAGVKKELAELKPDTAPIMKELPAGQRRVTKIQHRGNFLDVGKEVTEGTPAAFPPLPEDAPKDRLALARWLVDENNPLTPRVIANRHWEQIFGVGIVSTSEEFGAQGELPFHGELLDWLATEIVRLKWDIKAFHKLLVTSAAYRQSSRVTSELAQRDPDNRLLARGPRFRLSAETIRDQALFVSGLLSPKMYGPPVKPQQPSLGLSAAFGSGIDWQTSTGDDKYRRGLYTTWRRSNPYPSMATFDAPNREVCTVRRVRTNTPLQALVTLNDPVYIEAAQALARRMFASGGTTPAERAGYGVRLCLGRLPAEAETSRLVQLYEQAMARLSQNPAEAQKLASEPLGPPPKELNVTELAAWTVVANVLLNLDETIMKR